MLMLAVAYRNKLHMLRDQGDLFLPFEQRMTRDYRGVSKALHSRRHRRGKSGNIDPNVPVADTLPSHAVRDFGPASAAPGMMQPPGQMEMSRGPVIRLGDGSHAELAPDAALLAALDKAPAALPHQARSGLQRSWSVAY